MHLVQQHTFIIHLRVRDIILHQLDLQILRQVLVKLILYEESIWAHLEVIQGIILETWDGIRVHFVLVGKKRRHFDDHLLYLSLHVVLEFIAGDAIVQDDQLDLLDCVWIKQHSSEDQQRVGERLKPVEMVRGDITVPTSAESGRDQVKTGDVLLLKMVFVNILNCHPTLVIVSVCARHYFTACEQIHNDACLQRKGKNLQPGFDIMYFKNSPFLTVVINERLNGRLAFKKTIVSRKLEKEYLETIGCIFK